MLPRTLLRARLRAPPAAAPSSAFGLPKPASSPRPLSTSPPVRLPAPPRYRRFGDPVFRQPPPEYAESAAPVSPFGFGRPGGSAGGGGGGGRWSLRQRFANLPPIVWVVAAGGGVYYVFHLEKSPTGRWRFMDTSLETEATLGDQSFKEVMQQYQGQILSSSHPDARFVQSVVNRIVRSNGLEPPGKNGWQTFVIRDDVQNAFVTPGGHIFVFTGILPVAGDADGLAVVLGHEIAHQVARHNAERYSSMKVLFGLGLILDSLGIDVGIRQIVLNLFLSLPNSRASETEADLIGLRLATAACYDPRAATGLWQRMGQLEGGQGGGISTDFLSTHPSSSKRVEKVTEWAKEILPTRPDSCGPIEQHVSSFSRASGARW